VKKLEIRLPIILEVVDEEQMNETLEQGEHIVIAVPLGDVKSDFTNKGEEDV